MSIGRSLTEARESAGLTVDEVAAATRIRRTLVLAIERDDFSSCGGDFYARGHVRSVARTVGVDARPLLAVFDDARPGAAPPRASDVFESEVAARPPRRGPNWSLAMALALVVVVVLGVAQVLSSSTREQDRPRPDRPAGASRSPGPGGASPAPASSEGPAETGAVTPVPRERVTVVVRARGRSWLQVTSGSGRELFQGVLEDRAMTFAARRRVRLLLGDAGAVLLTVNGTPFGLAGEPGQVVRVQFTPGDGAPGRPAGN